MAKKRSTAKNGKLRARERLIASAYELYSRSGTNRVGIDRILAESGAAKASLYKHFKSKTELTLAVLERREQIWTQEWLIAEVRRRARTPCDRLLKIFDLFHEWFQRPDFEGCLFMKVQLETEWRSRENRAAIGSHAAIRAFVRGLIAEFGYARPTEFAQVWHELMQGSIIAAGEGQARAALHAKLAGKLLLEHWPRNR
jgi:AcrR family transcriptional regulator